MTSINDDSRVINKLEASLIGDARVIIYDCHMFIVQATGESALKPDVLICLLSFLPPNSPQTNVPLFRLKVFGILSFSK